MDNAGTQSQIAQLTARLDAQDARIAALEAQNASLMLRLVEAQERSATALEQQLSPAITTPTSDPERDAISLFCQLESEGRYSRTALSHELGIARTTLNGRIEKWPTFRQFEAAYLNSGGRPRRGRASEAN